MAPDSETPDRTTDAGDGPEEVETIAGRVPTPPRENRGRHALVWGVVGVLAFGVLHQAYLFLGGRFLGFLPVAGVALFVGAIVALTAYRMAYSLTESNEQG